MIFWTWVVTLLSKKISKRRLSLSRAIDRVFNIKKKNYDIRTFIAYDYDGVNLSIIEQVIRHRLPYIKKIVDKILEG